jgi:hypothetical protein
MPALAPPCESKVYQYLREAARMEGFEEPFRRLCMLLDAPSDLRFFLIVARTIRQIFEAVASRWDVDASFVRWPEIVHWVLDKAAAFPEPIRNSIHPAAIHPVHPMYGYMSRYPLYAMMCNSQQVGACKSHFRLLQFQILTARARELEEQKKYNLPSYIGLYETNELSRDFAKKVRQPHHAALAVRSLSFEDADVLVEFMEPWQSPDVFASLLRNREGAPRGESFQERIEQIVNYCELKSSAREVLSRVAGDRLLGSTQPCYGYVEYNDVRFGVECDLNDPDDEVLDALGHELILDRTIEANVGEALLSDLAPDEDAFAQLVMVKSLTSQSGVPPDLIAQARTSILRLEIDRESLPWSAMHLRAGELEHTLLQTLRSLAGGECAADLPQLETGALVATCLETGRPIEHAITMVRGEDPRGSLTLLQKDERDSALDWCWQGIQPLYKSDLPFVDGKEIRRSRFIENPVHPVACSLLRLWMINRKEKISRLFTEPAAEYHQRVRDWLKSLDSSGRLTIAKIARMKWSLLSQLTGGDYAEVSLVLGLPHPRSRVPLFYSLLSLSEAQRLFAKATRLVWAQEAAD